MRHIKIIFSLLVLFSIVGVHSAEAQEEKFKALFLYKFAEYVEWPTGTNAIVIGVVGSPEVLKYLTQFAMKKPNLSVIEIQSSSESSKCNIVFLPKKKSKEISGYQTSIGSKSILLVTEDSKLTGKGADIGFFLEGGKLRFMLSEKSIRSKKMIPNSKLLSLGKSI